MSSDCFSIFLTYLDIKEILRLDSAFCNHNDRIEWLNLLTTLKPCISVENNQFANKIADWLILKNVHPVELSLQYKKDSNFAVSDEFVFKLTRNESRVKKFDIKGNYPKPAINKMLFSNVANHCIQLETLKLIGVEIPDGGLDSLSKHVFNLNRKNFNM